MTRFITGIRLTSWLLAAVADPISIVLWQFPGGVSIPTPLRVAPPLAGVIYGGTYLYGALTVGGPRSVLLALGFPLYAAFEALSPFYSMFFSDRDFTVVEK